MTPSLSVVKTSSGIQKQYRSLAQPQILTLLCVISSAMEIVLQRVTVKGLTVVQMLTYLLGAFRIRTSVILLLFTTRNARDQNTRILESKHHPFMSQYKHVVVSV